MVESMRGQSEKRLGSSGLQHALLMLHCRHLFRDDI